MANWLHAQGRHKSQHSWAHRVS